MNDLELKVKQLEERIKKLEQLMPVYPAIYDNNPPPFVPTQIYELPIPSCGSLTMKPDKTGKFVISATPLYGPRLPDMDK